MNTSTSPAAPLTDYLDLAYRPDLQLLTARWLRAVTFQEVQTGFEAVLALALEHRANHWLVDVRRRTELDVESSAWVAQHLLPRAARELLPAMLYVSYLLSPVRAEQLQTNVPLRDTTTAAQALTQPYRLRTFIDEGEAVQWLRQLG